MEIKRLCLKICCYKSISERIFWLQMDGKKKKSINSEMWCNGKIAHFCKHWKFWGNLVLFVLVTTAQRHWRYSKTLMWNIKCSSAEYTAACAVTEITEGQRAKVGGSGASEIKQGTVKLQQGLMAPEAILKTGFGLVCQGKKEHLHNNWTDQPLYCTNAWRGW